jgi:hypothetical protein
VLSELRTASEAKGISKEDKETTKSTHDLDGGVGRWPAAGDGTADRRRMGADPPGHDYFPAACFIFYRDARLRVSPQVLPLLRPPAARAIA